MNKLFKNRPSIDSAVVELGRRYSECDSQGHVRPDKGDNYCDHCFRHLTYNSPTVDAIREQRAHIPIHLQPSDASILIKREVSEIDFQIGYDYLEGLRKLEKELTSA